MTNRVAPRVHHNGSPTMNSPRSEKWSPPMDSDMSPLEHSRYLPKGSVRFLHHQPRGIASSETTTGRDHDNECIQRSPRLVSERSAPTKSGTWTPHLSDCSNSLIESWWRVIKHQWLYVNTLDSAAGLRRLVAFYVDQHNSHLPHSAFHGQTPDEMYHGTGEHIPAQLEEARLAARQSRLKCNRERSCHVCQQPAIPVV